MNRVTKGLASVLSLLLLGSLVWLSDLDRILTALAAVSLGEYGLATAVFSSIYVPLALRWQSLARTANHHLPLRISFEIIAVSYGVNKLLPANAGDLMRSKISQRYVDVGSHGAILGLVAVERLFDVGSIALAVFASSLFLTGISNETVQFVALFALLGSGMILAIFVWLRRGTSRNWRLPLTNVVLSEAGTALDTVSALSPKRLSYVGVLSLARWLVVAVSFQLLAAAIGVTVGFPSAVLVTSAMSLAAVLPLSPGGLGPVDAVGTGILVLLGIDYTQAFTLVLLQRSLGLVLMALVGVGVYNYRLAIPPAGCETD